MLPSAARGLVVPGPSLSIRVLASSSRASALARGIAGPRRAAASSGSSATLRESYGLWIDGREVPAVSGATMAIENPATGQVLSHVAEGREEDVNKAIDSAALAFEDGRWSGLEPRQRARVLNDAARLLRERIPRMAALETLQTGRCLREYVAQLGRVPDWYEYHAALAQTIEGNFPPFSDPDHHCYVRRVPLGVCGLVTSWNHPLLISNKKISVALAAGNTVVVKPPSPAPCSIIEMAGILKEAGVPDGVINVVPSQGSAAGAALTTHPAVVKLDLTGGTDTGYKLGEAAGRRALRFCAELGGNAAVAVFDDCKSIDVAVNGVCFAAFVASGQTCVSAKRILIQETIFDKFVSKLVDKVNGIRLLDPMDMNSQMGPVVHAHALAEIEQQVAKGIAEGAEVLAGGKRPPPERCPLRQGYFYEPTVLKIPGPDNYAFQEEIFGPVVTVLPFKDEAHAVALANDSRYGLGGGVWTSNVGRAHRMARNVRAGIFWVNAHHRNDPSCPWGGFKESGIGRENGWEAFREYTETQSVVVRTSDQDEDWFGIQDSRYS